jgi:ABC-2 type transport system permease protein
MEKDVKSCKQADVTLFINSSNIIVSNYLLSDGSKIIKMVSGGVLLKKLRSSGLMEDQAMNIISPIKIETMVLYNPNYSYVNYLAPGLTTFAYLMIIMVASVLILSSEFTHNTFNELLKLSENKISIIILGKSLPHIVIHVINLIILVGIIFPIFNIKIHSSWVMVLLFLIFFSIVVFALGFMISSLFRDQMFATELALFVVTPAFIFSGLTYPLWAMPWLFRFVADLIPYTHFLSGFTKLAQMGVPFRYVIPETIYLIIFLLISIITTVIALRYQIKKSLLIDEVIK